NNDVPAWLYSVLHYDSVRDEALQDSKAPKESPSFTGDFTYNKEGDTFDLRMGSFGEHSLELSMAHITSPEDYDSGVFVSYGDVLLKRLGNTLISLQNMGLLFPEGFFSLGDMTLIDGAKIINLLAVNPKEVQQTTITTAVTSLDASLGHIDIYYAGNTNISIDGVINIPTGATAFLTITLWHLGGVRSISWKASQLESVAPTLAGTSGGYDRLVLTPSKINAGKFFVICVESK
ncbi:MAG: hypothetical protein U1D97_06685, partial [Desulfuromonadales bacterium]|nr:hypothetical protein [Desulfuromonadales bacterium]